MWIAKGNITNLKEGIWLSNLSLMTLKKTLKPIAAADAKSLQSCPTLCDPIDGSPLGSAIPGILQARTLEWVAIFLTKNL